MKTCRVMKQPVQAHVNYGILKNFDDHMKVSISYMEFKDVLRMNNLKTKRFFRDIVPSYYFFEKGVDFE